MTGEVVEVRRRLEEERLRADLQVRGGGGDVRAGVCVWGGGERGDGDHGMGTKLVGWWLVGWRR